MHYINLFIYHLAIFSQVLVHDTICWRHGNIKLTWNPQDDSSLSQHICISTGNVLSKLMPHGNRVLLSFPHILFICLYASEYVYFKFIVSFIFKQDLQTELYATLGSPPYVWPILYRIKNNRVNCFGFALLWLCIFLDLYPFYWRFT